MSEAICRVMRGDLEECTHRGDIAVVDVSGRLIWHWGDPERVTYMRSAAKPIQVLPVIESGAAEAFGLTEREIAVMCGSHNGEDMHVEAVEGILRKIGLAEDALGCGTHEPLCRKQAASLIRQGRQPTSIFNNCSGKHSGMLALASYLGLSRDAYWSKTHPVQSAMKKVVSEMTDYPEERIILGIDGCGVPVFGLPLKNMAGAYARLADPSGLSEPRRKAVEYVMRSMARHPEMVAGTGRLCTDLIRATGGRVIGKLGADGVYCVAVRDHGVGIAMKVEDGNLRAIPPVVITLLDEMGYLTGEEARVLEPHRRPPVVNNRGEVVGFIESVVRVERSS